MTLTSDQVFGVQFERRLSQAVQRLGWNWCTNTEISVEIKQYNSTRRTQIATTPFHAEGKTRESNLRWHPGPNLHRFSRAHVQGTSVLADFISHRSIYTDKYRQNTTLSSLQFTFIGYRKL